MYNYNQPGPADPHYQVAYRQAERRVKAKLGFYWHLASYVTINGFLIVLYLVTGVLPGYYSYPWFVWPMFGWGIGLLFHFLGVFVFGRYDSQETRRRMIEQELERMGVRNTAPAGQYPSGPAGFPPAVPGDAPAQADRPYQP